MTEKKNKMSNLTKNKIAYCLQLARVVELVDTRDLKSLASNSVPVQVRLRVPSLTNYINQKLLF